MASFRAWAMAPLILLAATLPGCPSPAGDDANTNSNDNTTDNTSGGKLLDRAAAFSRLKAEALDPFEVDATMVNVFGPAAMLDADAEVAPRFEDPAAASIARTIERPTWFFWIDLFPDAGWLHPVAYAFVDAKTGAVELVGANYDPVVDGVAIPPTRDKSDPTFVFGLESPPAAPRPRANAAALEKILLRLDKRDPRSLGEAGTECCSGRAAIIIEMNYEHEGFQANPPAMDDVLQSRGYAVTHVKRAADGDASVAAINAALDALIASSMAQGGPLCQVILYYDGHGSDNAPFIYTASEPQRFLTGRDIAIKLSDVKACETSVIVHSCFSGNWLTPSAFGFLPTFRDRAPCVRLSMYTSASDSEFTYGRRGEISPFIERLFEKMSATPTGQALNLASRTSFAIDAFDLPLNARVNNLFFSIFGGEAAQTRQTPASASFAPKEACAPCCPTVGCGRLPNGFVDHEGVASEYLVQKVEVQELIDLSQFGFPQFPNAINNHGRMVGPHAPVSGTPGKSVSALFPPSIDADEGEALEVALNGASSVHALSINDDCEVAIEVAFPSEPDESHPGVLLLGDRIVTAPSKRDVRRQASDPDLMLIDRLPGDKKGRASDISDNGVVIGTTFAANGTPHPFVWAGGVTTALPTQDSDGYGFALAISRDAMSIAGADGRSPNGLDAVTWSGPNFQTRTALPPLSAGGLGQALDVDADRVVGGATVGSGFSQRFHPVIWTSGAAPLDLGTLDGDQGFARAISPSGTVVGNVVRTNGAFVAFAWSEGDGQVNLNERIDAGAGVFLLNATAINRAGQIVCIAANQSGAQQFVILTPTP
ncbi:hypothetical protein RAS1_15000 [Phycisphaerae bacterium RAS1]|nr:hypothetical protein RAS1_15000 [Phycisphaerae bacterium RAS1]